MERIWKEVVIEPLSRNLPEITEENHEKFLSGWPGRDSNGSPAEYQSGMLLLDQRVLFSTKIFNLRTNSIHMKNYTIAYGLTKSGIDLSV
jgi:hypothetical protein